MAYVLSSVSGNLISAASAGFAPTNSGDVSAIASSYAESAVSGKADSSALSSYVPYSSLEYNTASAISGINGSALAAGSTYSAGEGIDITDDVISVETPVDIVAGPGIVIDNPDGNTLRISCNSAYSTVLYSGANVTSATLADNVMNYEFVDFYLSDDTNQTLYLRMDTTRDPLRVGGWGGFGGVLNTSNNWFGIRFGVVSASANSAYSLPTDQMSIFMSGGFRYSGQSTYYSIFKVYGINRTASAQ